MGPTPVVTTSHNAAPRHPRTFAGVAGRAARALTTAISALALAIGALAVTPAPAHADEITSQEYVSYYHLDTAHAKGYTGKGVTIALIDGPVNLSDPELAGANITDKSRCTIKSSEAGKYHANHMAALIVSQKYGIAPDATLYTYQTSSNDDDLGTCADGGKIQDTFAILINQAIDDGAQIISISQSSNDHSDELKWAIARAMSEGVIIMASTGNTGQDENDSHLSWWSGVVGVAAVNNEGGYASDYSSWGRGVTVTAVGGPVNVRAFDTGKVDTTKGTSVSTAIASGLMALARQKWPDASANQLLQLMVKTALNPDKQWNDKTGYGAISLGDLVNTDPSQYPDENPIAQKQGGSSPTVAEVQQYSDGLVDPTTNRMGDAYTYRGTDEGVISHPLIKSPVHLGTSPAYHRK